MGLRPLFTWKFSGVLIPFFFGMGYAAMTYHQFVMGYVLSILGGIWALGYYFYSDSRKKRANTVFKLREAARKHETAVKVISKYSRARGWHYCSEIGTCAGVLIATGAFLLWLSLGQKEYELSLYEGGLLPANDPTPKNACSGHAPEGALTIILGNDAAYVTASPAKIIVISVNDKEILTLDRDIHGEVSITTDIYDQKGDIVTEIVKNKFSISKDVFQKIMPDYSSLAVVIRQHKEKVLDVRYINPSAIQITGIFRHPGNPTVTIAPDLIELGRLKVKVGGNCTGNPAILLAL